MELTVNPCIVNSLDIVENTIPVQIKYILDTPGINFGPYGFAQNPDCGYVMTETVEYAPNSPTPYLVHDADTSLFSIEQTADEAFLGLYQVVIRKSFD